jgi:hypothetical protein
MSRYKKRSDEPVTILPREADPVDTFGETPWPLTEEAAPPVVEDVAEPASVPEALAPVTESVTETSVRVLRELCKKAGDGRGASLEEVQAALKTVYASLEAIRGG